MRPLTRTTATTAPAASTARTARARRILLRTEEAGASRRVKCARGIRRHCGRVAVAGAAALCYAIPVGAAPAPATTDEPGSLPAAFRQRSYAPGAAAELVLWRRTPRVTLRLYRIGAKGTRRNDVLPGTPVGPPRTVRWRRVLTVAVPRRRSGLYFERLTGPGLVGYAPFVLRPARLGTSRVAVIEPTNTWQAYNFRDVDGDGVGDTWYADPSYNGVDLTRPFLRRGVPPHFRAYDLGFLRWLARSGHRVDFLSDDDLDRLSARQLARLYDLIVFPGHEEYVTEHVWDAVERYRDLGGNLAFLSANDFFYRVEPRGSRIYRTGRWRDVGRSESALIGETYVGWFMNRYKNRPYAVEGGSAAAWLYRGTGLHDGDTFGSYGIEISAKDSRSPRGTVVLAEARNLFGPGRSAQMTYYRTRTGAQVFSAGVINFGGSAEWPAVSRMLENLWRRLSRP